MNKNGKRLEQIVYLVQQTLKDAQGTMVYKNHKLKNESGEKREFDVVIESVVNGFKLIIAIECKDYNKPVGAEKIEAFNSKCARVKTIDKKIFISSKGFQSGALTGASAFGIDLYTVEEMAPEVILSWIPVKRLGLRYELKNPKIIADSDVYGTSPRYPKDRSAIYFQGQEEPKNIINLLDSAVYENRSGLWSANIHQFLRRQQNKDLPDCLEFNLELPLPNAYVWDTNDDKVEIMGIQADLLTWLIESAAEVEQAVAYQPLNGDAQAHGLKIKMGSEESADLILTGKGIGMFYNDKEGKSHRLVDLAVFDPRTGIFKKAAPKTDNES